MGQISITIQKRTYRVTCGDGEEARLEELAEYVRAKAAVLTEQYGRISDEHLMLMSALMVADELFDLRQAEPSNKADIRDGRRRDTSANHGDPKKPSTAA